MNSKMLSESTLHELKTQKSGLEDKIVRLRADLCSPMEADLDEQANQIGNREVVMKILESETNYLKKVNEEIEKRKDT